MKKIVSMMLGMVLLFNSFVLGASAEEVVSPKVMYTYQSTADCATTQWSAVVRGAYLGYGVSCIVRNDGTHINISGSTTATQYCDKIRLTLYVERSTSYSTGYSTYKSYYYSANNAYQIVKEISNIPVERGYYYRVYAVHSATHGGVTETTDSVTDPLSYF